MCGDGVGSANDSSNDDEKDSGNSLKETLANFFTPGDGMSYNDGVLTEDNSSRDSQFYDYSSSNNNDDGPGYANIMVDGKQKKIRRDANDKYKQRYASALFGAATGGLPGLLGSIATNELTKGKTGAGVLGIGEAAGNAVTSFKGLFAEPDFKNEAEKEAYRAGQIQRRDEAMASMQSGGDGPSVAPTAAPTVALPDQTGGSDMSVAAAQGAFKPIPNPDYDPNDPMSQQFLSNPTYAQLLAYQQQQNSIGMAEGGMLDRRQLPPAYMAGMMMTNQQSGSTPPLELYRSYIEKKYGDPTFDQKRDTFLNEVHQKEKETFSGGSTDFGLTPQPPISFFENRTQPMVSTGFTSMEDASRAGEGEKSMLLPGMGVPGQGYTGASTQDLLAIGPSTFAPAMGMAEGGELGGNEKTAISDAISAVKGQMPEEQAAIALGVFLQNYGEEALKNLVERVQSGEFDDTVDRFANGEAGEVVGPGDGSGVDDKVPASLEGQQDVLLADGEFVLRKKTADALEKKYGGGFLDTVNEAEDNAPRTMQEYMARA